MTGTDAHIVTYSDIMPFVQIVGLFIAVFSIALGTMVSVKAFRDYLKKDVVAQYIAIFFLVFIFAISFITIVELFVVNWQFALCLMFVWALLLWFVCRFFYLHYKYSYKAKQIIKKQNIEYKTRKQNEQDIEELNPYSKKYVGTCVFATDKEQYEYYKKEKRRREKEKKDPEY